MSKSPVLEISLVFHVSPGRAKWTSASSGPALARPWRSADPTHHSGAGLFLAEPLSLASASYGQLSDCENPRFTERTSTNLGRSHRLPHVCTIMIYGKLGGYRLQETAAFIYICDELWIICDIWVSLMWILEKYDDITLKRGIANLGRSHRLPRVFNNFHQFPSTNVRPIHI